MSLYRAGGKRVLDAVFAAVGLILLSPLFAVVGLIVLVCLGRPVLFRQQRPGRNGRPFTIYKFRTMSDEDDEAGVPIPDDRRLRPIGRRLRSWSLDELPELVNVLRGDMSLVGPRPLLMPYLERYSPRQMRRHEVRPGVTGWAQVHGRNASSWSERLELDVWYVDHVSLLVDLETLWRTLGLVVSGRGVSAPGHATMPEFRGDEE